MEKDKKSSESYLIPEGIVDEMINAGRTTQRLFNLGENHVLTQAVKKLETHCNMEDANRDDNLRGSEHGTGLGTSRSTLNGDGRRRHVQAATIKRIIQIIAGFILFISGLLAAGVQTGLPVWRCILAGALISLGAILWMTKSRR